MASISYTLSSSHPPALLCLRALTAAAGLTSNSVTNFHPTPLTSTASSGPASFGNSSSVKFQLSVETTDAFGSTSTSTVHGLVAVVRALSAIHPTLGLYGSSDAGAAKIEGWLESLSGVLEAAYAVADAQAASDEVKGAVESFGRSVEAALSSSSGKYLVGDKITAADIVVAVVLTAAATRCKADPLGAKTDDLLHAVCGAAVIKSAIGDGGMSSAEMKLVEGAVPKLAAEMKKLSVGGAATGTGSAGPTAAELAANPIVLQLSQLNLPADTTYGHALCVTADDLVANVSLPSSAHTHTKNLLFKDKKHGLFLVTTTPTAEVNTKALGKDMLGL